MKDMHDGRDNPPVSLKNWGKFVFGVVLLYLLGAVIAPMWNNLPAVRPLADFIEESGFDPAALYYTDVKETVDAEFYVRDSLKFSVRKKAGEINLNKK